MRRLPFHGFEKVSEMVTKKQMAMATATLVVQYEAREGQDLNTLDFGFESAIESTDAMRRIGEVTTERAETIVETRCDVEYGPIRANEADMRRHLERQAQSIALAVGGRDSAVFNLTPIDLSPEQLDDVIQRLSNRSHDIAVPLVVRKQLAVVVSRLRRGADAGRISRVPR